MKGLAVMSCKWQKKGLAGATQGEWEQECCRLLPQSCVLLFSVHAGVNLNHESRTGTWHSA